MTILLCPFQIGKVGPARAKLGMVKSANLKVGIWMEGEEMLSSWDTPSSPGEGACWARHALRALWSLPPKELSR